MKIAVLLVTILLTACSTLAPTIQAVPEGNLQLSKVNNSDVEQYVGELVRWGGIIVNVKAENGRSTLEIRHAPLARYGFPLTKNLPSQGSFIAQTTNELEPSIYLPGLLITFSGIVTAERTASSDRGLPHIDIVDVKLWPYNKTADKPYTYINSESEFKGYGVYGSGDYVLY